MTRGQGALPGSTDGTSICLIVFEGAKSSRTSSMAEADRATMKRAPSPVHWISILPAGSCPSRPARG